MNDDPMTKIIPFAVNKQQKKSIEHAANEAEVTVSTYCREAVLKRIENERRSYKTFECSECGGSAKCYEAAVLKNLGARSWWKCLGCGNDFTREKSPEEMEHYYQLAKAGNHSTPQEGEA